MRVVEGSAFVAAPLGGMTLAQLGADVIRFDPIGGGLDANRWPVTAKGRSLFWAGLNKGKRSIAVAMRSPQGKELLTDLITAPGDDAGLFLTNFPAVGWLDFTELTARRHDVRTTAAPTAPLTPEPRLATAIPACAPISNWSRISTPSPPSPPGGLI